VGAALQFTCFNDNGYVVGGGQVILPEWLDWKSIEEKEVYMMYMGGFHPDTVHIFIASQGQRKLLVADDASRVKVDYKERRRKEDAAEKAVARICDERGIDRARKPRNQ